MSKSVASIKKESGRAQAPMSLPPGLTNAAEFFCIEFVAAAQCAFLHSRTAFLQEWGIDDEKYHEVAYIENEALRSAVRGYVARKLQRGSSLESFCIRELLDICLHRQREQRSIDRLLHYGVSNELLDELFGLPKNKARLRRKTLGATRPTRFKQQAPVEDVLNEWVRATSAGLGLAERYVAVCEATGEYPDNIKHVVHQHAYDDENLRLPIRPFQKMLRQAV